MVRDTMKIGEPSRGAECVGFLQPVSRRRHDLCNVGTLLSSRKAATMHRCIIEAGISRVVTGSGDPNPLVGGKGIRILKDHGIQVTEHVLKEECDGLNPVFSITSRLAALM